MPDLVPTAFGNLPAAVLPGATFAATDTVQNQGLVTAAGVHHALLFTRSMP